MPTYQEELRNFQQQWQMPRYDLKTLAETTQQLRYADMFLTGASVDNSPAGQFVKLFSRTLSRYFESNTALREDVACMSSFNAQEFYDSFKKLMQAKYNDDGVEKNKEPLLVNEVITDEHKKTITNVIANCKSKYKTTLPNLWKQNLKDGSVKVFEMREKTSNLFYAMTNENAVKENYTESLKKVVSAYEAMKQLRESRKGFLGWFWKLFNGTQNDQEKDYLELLESQINTLKEKNYDVDGMTAEVTGKTVFGKEVESAEKAKAKTAEKTAKKRLEKKYVADTISVRYYEEGLGSVVANELDKQLPVESRNSSYDKTVYERVLLKNAFKDINELNEAFDAALAEGNDYKKETAKLVRGVFKIAVKQGNIYLNGTSLEKSIGYEIIAKVLMDNLTAVALYPELRDLANEYLKNNVGLYKELASNGKSYGTQIDKFAMDYVPKKDIVVEIKEEKQEDIIDDDEDNLYNEEESYYEGDKEKVFSEDNPFPENGAKKSSQVSQETKINPLTMNNNK